MSLGIQKGGMLNSKKLRLTKEILLVKLIHPTRKARTITVEPRQNAFSSLDKKESNKNTINMLARKIIKNYIKWITTTGTPILQNYRNCHRGL